MPAWKRFGMWAVVLCGSTLGAEAQAAPFGQPSVNWNWWSTSTSGMTPGDCGHSQRGRFHGRARCCSRHSDPDPEQLAEPLGLVHSGLSR